MEFPEKLWLPLDPWEFWGCKSKGNPKPWDCRNSWNRKIMESWNGLCGKLLPFQRRGQLPGSRWIQPGLGHFPGWGSHSFSGNSIPFPARPPSQGFLPQFHLNPPFPGAIPCVPSLQPFSPGAPGMCWKLSLDPSLLQGNIPSSPSLCPEQSPGILGCSGWEGTLRILPLSHRIPKAGTPSMARVAPTRPGALPGGKFPEFWRCTNPRGAWKTCGIGRTNPRLARGLAGNVGNAGNLFQDEAQSRGAEFCPVLSRILGLFLFPLQIFGNCLVLWVFFFLPWILSPLGSLAAPQRSDFEVKTKKKGRKKKFPIGALDLGGGAGPGGGTSAQPPPSRSRRPNPGKTPARPPPRLLVPRAKPQKTGNGDLLPLGGRGNDEPGSGSGTGILNPARDRALGIRAFGIRALES
ncbi:uncharacterized protein LOC116781824 [Chiroxiphia lanceolata]|uniref:uncharacterized protein LOC116781824 n=1 Tax=Chiroxiphia lanceolata TaxID=296741 RepID=UPI0013CE7809|nr:uncharacterized protein LOC116781824 [Chiroxiphia lanceolata]